MDGERCHRVARGDPRRHPLGARRAARRGRGSTCRGREVKLLLALLGAILLAVTASAGAAVSAEGTLEITVLFPAGSSADVTARMLADGMSQQLGQRVLVVNRPGAGGAIGYKHVAARSPTAIRWCGTPTRSPPPTTPASCRSTTRRSTRWRACWSNRRCSRCAPTRAGKRWPISRRREGASRQADRRPLGHRQPHAHLVGGAVQGRGRGGQRGAVRRGAGGAEPARRPRRCGGAAARRALGAGEAGRCACSPR